MKLMVLDGNSVLNRAFYGVRQLNTRDGTPTNAVYGFLNILFMGFLFAIYLETIVTT